jgi:hypothetical protein
LSVTGTDPHGSQWRCRIRSAQVARRSADETRKFVIDNVAADRIPDGDPRNAQAIADQIDEPPRKENVDEWPAPRTQSRTTGELDRSSRDWTIGTEGSNSSRSVSESSVFGILFFSA